MVLDREVLVTVRDTDEHGRTVGEVWVGERSLNAALVEEGLAWAFRRYSERFVPEEAAARSARRGLWAEREAQPPWEWRSERRSAPLPSAGGVRR
jgi:endonuclease YncB( thermonuclease family)